MIMNLLQQVIDAVLGSDVLSVADLDPDILFMGCLFLAAFAYLALRSLARFCSSLTHHI